MPDTHPYILLVDDDDDDIEKLSASFGLSDDMGLKAFNSWDKAVFYLNQVSRVPDFPSLIILDYNMPRKNGGQVLLLIKGLDRFRNIPVIIYSANMTPVLKDALISRGALNCYLKTYNGNEFTNQVSLFKDVAFSFFRQTISG